MPFKVNSWWKPCLIRFWDWYASKLVCLPGSLVPSQYPHLLPCCLMILLVNVLLRAYTKCLLHCFKDKLCGSLSSRHIQYALYCCLRQRLHWNTFKENESELTVYPWKNYRLGCSFMLIRRKQAMKMAISNPVTKACTSKTVPLRTFHFPRVNGKNGSKLIRFVFGT